MIHSKNRIGFTLIEAIIAVAIMGIVLTPIYILLTNSYQTSIRRSFQLDRSIQAHLFLIDARRAVPKDTQTFMLEKKTTKPVTILKYELKEPAADSPIKKVSNMLIEQVTMQWQEGNRQFTDTLTTLMYKPKSAKA
ncbi:MAG TPA: prepilin-type N-terminal cleavage/methylation domain-containing protein [Candidatus Babeliales bacterium]|nr:prepilin-type N-terminal cleavage/methylation domain-containing protein [Candidatus Babeliales bacterium]